MAYIGKSPAVGNFIKLDAITTSATATYNLVNGGVAYSPESVNHMLVSLNGVIQSPTTAFTVSGTQIIFASTLSSSDVIDFIMVYGDVLNLGVPSDATVTDAKITAMAASKLTGALPAISGASLTALNATNIGSGTVPTARLGTGTASSSTVLYGDQTYKAEPGGGKILQVVGTTKSDTASWTANATVPQDTGLECAITCAATSSKVIVMWQVNIGYQGAITQDMIHLTRNDTEVNQGDAASSRKRANSFWGGSHSSNKLNYMSNTYSGMFLDSPSSTSELTYKVEHTDATAAGTYYINRTDRDNDAAGYDPRTVSNMILVEVGA